jgi:hypothetical protein
MNRIRHAWSMLTWKPTWHRVFYGGKEYLFHDSALRFDPTPLRFRWQEPWHIGAGVDARYSAGLRAGFMAAAAIRDPYARVIAVDAL